ncbi:uncharacterized protein LOC129911726 [Episyrphus balteatus]|uniref:uncharacterized protein LOC129911726 n=1 Tax=Episyrphus balteatus TaxID=286459 RepID=UPI002486459A|nr:uncharacterized protein LOC129911726 [Episyrphus balteatus]
MEESTFQMKTLQDYEVISVIGSGAFGTCFKVRDKDSGEIYAWKGMDYDELSETKKESLISEINVLRQLKHPNIVQYHHHIVNHETKSIFIVMECCEGGDLSQLIDKCRKEKLRFEEKYIWRILFQICKALQVCHNKIKEGTILHRDIKPANIFLDTEGNAKLGDFGLARVLRRNESFAETFVGTPYYMSPEIVKGSKYDRKSDVWAVGCLIYEMCSLRPPFKGRKFEQLSKNISGGKYNCIPSCYSSDMQEIISFMLEVENDSSPSIDIITRHPVLIRNIVDIPNEFPKLITIEEVEEDSKWKLTFTPREDLSSTALTHLTVNEEVDKHVTGVSTPVLRSEIFNSTRRRINPRTLNCSDPELYESIREIETEGEPTIKPTTKGYSPTVITQTIFEKTLQDRLHAIRAHESLLKHREANILVREKNLNEREKRIQEMERNLEAKQAAVELMSKRIKNERKPKPLPPRRTLSTRNIAPVRDCNDTYCSIEPNDTVLPPTVAKLNFAAMPPPKSLARKVTFKSPKKFTKYDIENIPPAATNGGRDSKCSTLRSSVSSKTSEESDGGHSHKRKSILSIFGLNKVNKDNKSTTNQQDHKSSNEILDKCQPEELSSMWTSENKKAAFDMLAAMNAAAEKFGSNDVEQINSRKCRQSVHERGGSLRRSQLIRRSVIGLSTGLTKLPDHGSRIIV